MGDILEFKAIKQAKSQKLIPTDDSIGGIPYIIQSTTNNMFARNVNKKWLIDNNEAPVSGNRIVLGVTLPAVSYQPKEFGASQVITAKADWLNAPIGNFIVVAISKLMYQFSYNRKPGLQIYKDMSIKLPAKNDEIDFEFMESFMKELEHEKIKKIEAYLAENNLEDCTLTAEEEKALADYEDGNIEWKDEKVVELFEVKNSRNILSRDVVEGSGDTPYLCASADNNAVSSYISHDPELIEEGNSIFIGGKTFVVTYQEKDFYSNDSHNLVLSLKSSANRNKLNQLFLVTLVNRGLNHKYSWGDSISNKKIQSDIISIPTKNNLPNYELMKLLVSAVQKLITKDLILYIKKKS